MSNVKKTDTNKTKRKPASSGHKTSIPSMTRMRAYFEQISKEKFKKLINKIIEKDNNENIQSFLYYIMLFRDLENITDCLNDNDVPIEFVEKLIIFTMGYCSMYNYSALSTIDFMVLFLSEERLLELIQKSQFIKGDKLLMFHILTRLDKNSLDIFFDNQENLIDAISSYYRLPEEVMTSVISRNRKFFDYIMMRLLSEKNLDSKAKLFINKFEKIIKEFQTMGHIIMKYHAKVNLTEEGKLPFNERDMDRISFLVNTIRSMPDWEKAVNHFSQGGVFVDEQERQIVFALVTDPLLKNIFPGINEEHSQQTLNDKIDEEDKVIRKKNYFNLQATELTS